MTISRAFIFLLLIITTLLILSDAAKIKKPKGTGKGQGKKKKTKASGADAPKLLSPATNVPFTPIEGEDYWAPGGANRVWDPTTDDPLTSSLFKEQYLKLVQTLKVDPSSSTNTTSKGLPDFIWHEPDEILKTEPYISFYNVMLEMWDKGFFFTWTDESEYFSTLFAAFVDTKNGTDIPEVLQNFCTIQSCVADSPDPALAGLIPAELLTPSHVQDETDYTLISRITQRWYSQLESLLETFMVEDTWDIMCATGGDTTTAAVTTDVIRIIEELDVRLEDFMADPGAYGARSTKEHLKLAYEVLEGKLLLDTMSNFCDTARPVSVRV